MQNKELLTSVGILLIIVIGGYFLLKNKGGPAETKTEEQVEISDAPIDPTLFEEKTIKKSEKYAVFDVKYPQFKNASLVFNKKIESTVTEAIDIHNENAEANWKARLETKLPEEEIPAFPPENEKFPLNTDWMPVQVNRSNISILLVISSYSGGAHGNEIMTSFNYDVTLKKEIALKDLFPDNPDYLKTLSEFSRTTLEKQFKKMIESENMEYETAYEDSILPMLRFGTEPNIENFSTFTFTPQFITVYFAQYQVAPYAMGASYVTIERK